MAISRETSGRITDLLKDHPKGISITDIVKIIPLNRNTASRYLDTLLVSGQVEMRHFGMSKLYSLAKRLPVSSVLSISSEYVMQIDHSLRIVFINRPFLDLLDLLEKDVVGKKIENSRIPPLFDEEYPELLRWISEGLSGLDRREEIPLKSRNRILECHIAPAVFSDGLKGISVIFEDITARRQDEARLRESEGRYRTLVEIAPDAVILHRNGRILYANPAAVHLLGASHPDEILEKNLLAQVKPQYLDTVRRMINKDLKGLPTPPLEMEMVRLDGTPITIEGRGVRTFLDGEPAIQVTMRDITRKKQADLALQKSESLLKSIIQVAPVGIGLVVDRVIREANKRLCEMAGFTEGELNGQSVRMLYFSQEEFDRVGLEKCAQIARDGMGSLETRWRKKDGVAIDILISSTPLDPEDSSSGFIFTALDITRRKQSEQASRLAEERYRQLIECSFNAVIIHQNGKILLANDAACVIAGVQTPDDLIGQSLVTFIHPDCQQLVAGRVREMLAEPGTAMPLVRETFRRINGDPVEVEVMATSYLENGTPVIQVILREIPGPVKREKRLKVPEK